eukprot:GHVU01119837.1.p3 GENE.GHVU01119837.1~~GHVU01119837.1.p3  ORF type:complete len:196 (-),score=44.16 GHVU01119837.1:1307-1894(-)
MNPLVTKAAPDFKAETVLPDNTFAQLTLSEFKGNKHVILFFYPYDFTFVCPSEIIAFDRALEQFDSRGVQVIGVSTDSHFSHLAWKNTPVKEGGIGQIKFPLVSDIDKSISRAFGVLYNESVSLRGLFLIDKEGIVRHSVINDTSLGRSVDEALRIVDALQHHELHGEVCPANWKKGDKAMKPTAEGVSDYLSKN